jgi:hypothetical protein
MSPVTKWKMGSPQRERIVDPFGHYLGGRVQQLQSRPGTRRIVIERGVDPKVWEIEWTERVREDKG